jgi:hypothetical protein
LDGPRVVGRHALSVRQKSKAGGFGHG